MRSLGIWTLALLAVLFCGMSLQQWQLVRVRGLVARQASALAESQQHVSDLTAQLAASEAARALASARTPLRRPAGDSAFWREDERRLMLSSYSSFLAQANLPAARMARLKDLLVERAEAVSDARDAAGQEGIAEGTPEMDRVLAAATADMDREITGLIGPPSDPRLQGLAASPGPEESAAPAAPSYAYVAVASPSLAYAPAATEYPAADYGAVEGVLYGFRREGRFSDRAQAGRRLFEVPRQPGTPPVSHRPEARFPASAGLAH